MLTKILNSYFKLVGIFISKKQKPSLVAVDITSDKTFKVVEFMQKDDVVELQTIQQSRFSSEADFAEKLKSVFEQLQQPCRYYVTSLSGKGTLMRFLEMPRMTADDFEKSFSIELDKYFPFSKDEIHSDFHIIDPAEKSANMSVIVAAVKKELVEDRIKLTQGVDIPQAHLGLNTIGLINAVQLFGFTRAGEPESKEKEVVAVVDMGQSVSSLIIFVDRVPQFTRDIYIGGRDLTARIAYALGIKAEEAEKKKREATLETKDVLQATESTLLNIVQELRLSFDYFSTEKQHDVTRVYLTGGASMLPNVSEVFQRQLGLNVGHWNYWESSKFRCAKEIVPLFKNKAHRLATTCGLALYLYDQN